MNAVLALGMPKASLPLRGKREAFCLWRSCNGGNLTPSSAYKSAGYQGDRIALSSNSGTLMLDPDVKARIDWLNDNNDAAKYLFTDMVQKKREVERILKTCDISKIRRNRNRSARMRTSKPIALLPDEEDKQVLEALLELVIDDATAAVEFLQDTIADPAMVRLALDLHRASVSAREAHLDALRRADTLKVERQPHDVLGIHTMMNNLRRYLAMPETDKPEESVPDAPQDLRDIDRTERLLRQNLRWNLAEYDKHITNKGDLKEALRLLDTMLKTLVKISRLTGQRVNLQISSLQSTDAEPQIDLVIVTAALNKLKLNTGVVLAAPYRVANAPTSKPE